MTAAQNGNGERHGPAVLETGLYVPTVAFFDPQGEVDVALQEPYGVAGQEALHPLGQRLEKGGGIVYHEPRQGDQGQQRGRGADGPADWDLQSPIRPHAP